jgi:hypothetical protein
LNDVPHSFAAVSRLPNEELIACWLRVIDRIGVIVLVLFGCILHIWVLIVLACAGCGCLPLSVVLNTDNYLLNLVQFFLLRQAIVKVFADFSGVRVCEIKAFVCFWIPQLVERRQQQLCLFNDSLVVPIIAGLTAALKLIVIRERAL